MLNLKSYSWLIFIVFFNLLLFFPIFKGLVPIPLDVLTGAYYPWLDYKWGYSVGVPVKNASISDVVSQLFVWRKLAVDLIREGNFPLWNPYSHSGMPLLANMQSAVLYPFNIFMLIFGNINGWTLLVILQTLLSQILMYLFLRTVVRSKIASLTGAVVFSLSGYMMTNLEYVTVGHTFLWTPALLLTIHHYFAGQKKLLSYAPFLVFMQISAGSVYPLVFSTLICGLYLIFQKINSQSSKNILWPVVYIVSGFILSAIQLIPSMELLRQSIRFVDPNIVEHVYGLLPFKYLATLFAPDIFGNPSTGNFFGFLGYQETSGYPGLVSLIIIFAALPKLVRHTQSRFWLILSILMIIMAYDSPLSRLVYNLHFPLISSWYASRALLPFTFFSAILVSFSISILPLIRFRNWFYSVLLTLSILGLLALLFQANPVSLRNLIFPGLLVIILTAGLVIFKSAKAKLIFLLLLISTDLFRYYSKFTPFSPSRLDFPTTPLIRFLNTNLNNFRIDREKAAVFPPNSLVAYRLLTPSGYDPLTLKSYAAYYDSFYNQRSDIGQDYSPTISRYHELTSYQSSGLDLFGVKYLVALKRDWEGQIRPWGKVNDPQLLDPKFKAVYSDGATVVLENTRVLPRALVYSDFSVSTDTAKVLKQLQSGFDFRNQVLIDSYPDFNSVSGISQTAQITKYSPNQVQIQSQSSQSGILVLSDVNFAGWQAVIDGKSAPILTAFGIFRAVAVPAGIHSVVFSYHPKLFIIGALIYLIVLVLLIKIRQYLIN